MTSRQIMNSLFEEFVRWDRLIIFQLKLISLQLNNFWLNVVLDTQGYFYFSIEKRIFCGVYTV